MPHHTSVSKDNDILIIDTQMVYKNKRYYTNTTLHMIFSVTYYLKLRNVVSIYCMSHIQPPNVKAMFGHLFNINNFT